MKDTDEAGRLDASADLLQALARGRNRGVLVVVDEPSG
jgi:hypothetical protein